MEEKFNWDLPADPEFGIKTDKPLTRKEKLLAFIGFKAGSLWERLVEDQSQ